MLELWRAQVGAPPSRPRGQRSRAQLLEAAREIFARDGFQHARVTDIADRAGVSHGTFYTYFESKDLVLKALILEMQDALLGKDGGAGEDAHDVHDDDPMRAIERANRGYLEAFQTNQGLSIVWEQVAATDPEVAHALHEAKQPFVQRTERAIRRLQRAGKVDSRVDPTYAAHALTGMVSRFAFAWFSQGHPFDMERAVRQLTLLWTNALGVENQDL